MTYFPTTVCYMHLSKQNGRSTYSLTNSRTEIQKLYRTRKHTCFRWELNLPHNLYAWKLDQCITGLALDSRVVLLRGYVCKPWHKRCAGELEINKTCSTDLRQWCSSQKSNLEMVVTWMPVQQRFECGLHFWICLQGNLVALRLV